VLLLPVHLGLGADFSYVNLSGNDLRQAMAHALMHLVAALRKRHSGDSQNRCKIQAMPEQSEKSVSQPGLDELISLSQAAELSRLSPSHLRLLVSQGEIWGRKLGRNWFTTEQAVRQYLTRGVKPGPKPKRTE
jgi:hypothetical protein